MENKIKDNRKNIIQNVVGGLIVAGITLLISYLHDYFENGVPLNIEWIKNPITGLQNLYFKYSIPMRFNMYIWVTVFFIYYILSKYDKRFDIESKRKVVVTNYKNLIFFIYAFCFTLGLINIEKSQFIIPMAVNMAIDIIGIILTILGFLVLVFGRVEIDGLWGPHVYEYSDSNFKRLVKTGIYSYMRHPIYLGQIILSISTFTLSKTFWFAIFPIFVIVTNMQRALIEEKNLEKTFPNEYEEYQKTVNKWFVF